MIKLNDNSLAVGQIKQLLHNFNLPRCPIYTDKYNFENDYLYTGYAIYDNVLYYRNSKVNTEENMWDRIDNYIEGKEYVNVTTRLDINSKYYDEYTHRYLGSYLRFIRDYHHINLFSMYNYSINRTLDKPIYFREDGNTETSWNPDDNDIYIIPISWANNQPIQFTIYVEGSAEFCLSLYDFNNNVPVERIYNNYPYEERIIDYLYRDSHKKIYCQSKDNPYLLTSGIYNDDIYSQYRDNFCLLIKLPRGYDGPVIALEGNYTFGCKTLYGKQVPYNQINLDMDAVDEEGNPIKNKLLKAPLWIARNTFPQLLSKDNNQNYLIADKLLEYLTGNAISRMSSPYDINKLQKWLYNNKEHLKHLDNGKSIDIVSNEDSYPGFWSKGMLLSLNNLFNYYVENYENPYYDFCGYCDSTMEKLLEDIGLHLEYEYGGIV